MCLAHSRCFTGRTLGQPEGLWVRGMGPGGQVRRCACGVGHLQDGAPSPQSDLVSMTRNWFKGSSLAFPLEEAHILAVLRGPSVLLLGSLLALCTEGMRENGSAHCRERGGLFQRKALLSLVALPVRGWGETCLPDSDFRVLHEPQSRNVGPLCVCKMI